MQKKWQASQAFNINSATSVPSLFFNKFILFNGKIRPYFLVKLQDLALKHYLNIAKFRVVSEQQDATGCTLSPGCKGQ